MGAYFLSMWGTVKLMVNLNYVFLWAEGLCACFLALLGEMNAIIMQHCLQLLVSTGM